MFWLGLVFLKFNLRFILGFLNKILGDERKEILFLLIFLNRNIFWKKFARSKEREREIWNLFIAFFFFFARAGRGRKKKEIRLRGNVLPFRWWINKRVFFFWFRRFPTFWFFFYSPFGFPRYLEIFLKVFLMLSFALKLEVSNFCGVVFGSRFVKVACKSMKTFLKT